MFFDSNIVKKFICGEKKVSYFICFGIVLYFKSFFKEKVKFVDGYVFLFDESLNYEL